MGDGRPRLMSLSGGAHDKIRCIGAGRARRDQRGRRKPSPIEIWARDPRPHRVRPRLSPASTPGARTEGPVPFCLPRAAARDRAARDASDAAPDVGTRPITQNAKNAREERGSPRTACPPFTPPRRRLVARAAVDPDDPRRPPPTSGSAAQHAASGRTIFLFGPSSTLAASPSSGQAGL